MGFINSLTDVVRTNPLGGDLEGEVVDNRDPKMMYRIKARIPGVLDESDPEKLPWIYPQFPNNGKVGAPAVGTQVTIRFSDGNLYFGKYIAQGTGTNYATQIPSLLSEYPSKQGSLDPAGNLEVISSDPNANAAESISADGTSTINDQTNSTISERDAFGNSFFYDKKNGQFKAAFCGIEVSVSKGKVSITCDDFELNAKKMAGFVSDYLDIKAKTQATLGSEKVAIDSKNFEAPQKKT